MNATKTSDYEMFKTMIGNRYLNETQVKKLVDSIRIKNLLEQNPIIINDKYEIIDGQHRLEAAKRLEIPVYYEVVNNATLNEIHLLNANVRPWQMKDYLESYISMGNKNYIILKDFMKHYGLNFSIAVSLLANKTKTKAVLEDFRTGRFEIYDLKVADQEAIALTALKQYTETNAWSTRDYVSAIKRVWAKVNPEAFLEKASKRAEKFRKRTTVKDYLRDFEDTYNFGLKVNQIRFY